MKKIILSGLVAGCVLLLFTILGLYVTLWLFPQLAVQYFDPVYSVEPERAVYYYLHPFVLGLSLAFFWNRFKAVVSGSFFTRGIEFGLIYALIASFPMLWLIYSSMNVSLEIVATWFALAFVQGIFAGLIFEKINP